MFAVLMVTSNGRYMAGLTYWRKGGELQHDQALVTQALRTRGIRDTSNHITTRRIGNE